VKVDHKRHWVVLTIVLAVIAGAVVGLRKSDSFHAWMSVMSVHDRVTTVVQGWAHLPARPSDKQELEVIWAKSGLHFEFFPYAAQDLTTKLKSEFRDSKTAVLEFNDIYASTNQDAKIKTVKDLATAVRQNYTPQ
jgi:hypothetical protein